MKFKRPENTEGNERKHGRSAMMSKLTSVELSMKRSEQTHRAMGKNVPVCATLPYSALLKLKFLRVARDIALSGLMRLGGYYSYGFMIDSWHRVSCSAFYAPNLSG